jgi:hypothetical protein
MWILRGAVQFKRRNLTRQHGNGHLVLITMADAPGAPAWCWLVPHAFVSPARLRGSVLRALRHPALRGQY